MRFLLIGGFGRSGSSFLQDLLCRHPNISGGPEFNFTQPIFSLFGQMNKPNFTERNKVFYSEKDLMSNFQSFYESFFKSFNTDPNSTHYLSEKTPNNYLVTDEFFKLYPDGKFIFIYRDGRDAVLSYRNVFKKNPGRFKNADYSIKTLCRLWNSAMTSKKKLGLKYPNQLLQVKFEELILNPDQEIERILNFLELDNKTNLLHQKSNKVYHPDPAFHPETLMKQSVNPAAIGKWKSGFSFWEKWLVNFIMSIRLEQENYKTNPFWLKASKLAKSILPP